MTKSRILVLTMLLATIAMTMVFTACPTTPPLNPLTLLPTDASATCTVTPAVFKTWFQSGSVTLNGVVNPANSVTFPNVPNCSFYQWAEQDFLWLTSPAPATYGGGGGLIVDSPTFYDVSPPAADGSRAFLPHTSGLIRPFALRSAQADAQGLQMTFDSSGTPIQVKAAEREATPLVLNSAGQQVQVAHARRGPNGKPILLDRNGSVIELQFVKGIRPEAKAQIGNAEIPTMITAQKFIIDGIPIFIDPSLEVIDVEQGEADSGVLEAQSSAGGSLVYYATIVNDVYAYYATGVKDGTISSTQFPTSAGDLSNITSFAAAHGKTFPDPNALAIEVKSAWIAAAGLPNLSSYITMNATIPVYSPAVPPPAGTSTMTATGAQQTVQLALVGMHVVGSAAGHPEMIWSTFEHAANAPADTYSYINTSNATATVNANVANVPVIGGVTTNWVFSATTAGNNDSAFNNPNMSYQFPPSPATINAVATPPGIAPSNTMRWKPFGAASDVAPNPIDPSIAASNTEIISINNSVGGMLAAGDIRGNYVMTGATWTIGGAAPNAFIGGNQVGTSSLANTTMETYEQGVHSNPTHQAGGSNCFSCHTSNTTNVSHVFAALKPLF
ncbi:MAG: hypothetical protein WBQ72_22485 [Terriglobales bacterium]|jgi:hypothetical protein